MSADATGTLTEEQVESLLNGFFNAVSEIVIVVGLYNLFVEGTDSQWQQVWIVLKLDFYYW